MPHPSPLRRFIWIVVVGVLIGALYSDVQHGTAPIGALVGGSMGAAFFALERFVLRRNAGGLFGRLPFCLILACARVFMPPSSSSSTLLRLG